MKIIILDAINMKTKDKAHKYIKKELGFPNYYGKNLDALYDVLMEFSQPVHIVLKNQSLLIDNLGNYGKLIINVFKDASEENNNLIFNIQ